MSVLKTSLLMCLQHMMEEKDWHQVTRLPSPTLIYNFYIALLIPGVWIHQLQVMGEPAIYPSFAKAWTPLSSTHWKHLLYFPVLTSS